MIPKLQHYCTMVDFIADMLGNNAEVVLHDLSELNNSVIAIRNGHISGRTIGSPATDLLLQFVKNESDDGRDYLCNYRATSPSGHLLRASTCFIRDQKGALLGALCVNLDMEDARRAKKIIDQLLAFHDPGLLDESAQETPLERFSRSAEDLIRDTTAEAIGQIGVQPERISPSEKVLIVEKLNNRGIFQLKGAVAQVAAALKTSEPSIYRYLNQIKSGQAHPGSHRDNR